VPFVTGSFTSTSGSSTPTNPFQTIKRENVGITLKIKPQINEGDAVKLDIEQSVDSLGANVTGAADLVTNTRSIKTAVIVNNGQTMVLGGLIDDNVTESEQKVPLLGDIPLLGWLFKYKSTTNKKQNLMIFMRPTIIRDQAMANNLTVNKYSLLRDRQLKVRDKGLLFMPSDSAPLLPPVDEFLARPPALSGAPPATDGAHQDGTDNSEL
jgi:general secretion pathway protein D